MLAGLLAYPLHFVITQALDFHGLVGRGAEIFLVIGLFPLGRWLGMGKLDLGLPETNRELLRQIATGLAIGTGMLAVHVALLLLLDVRDINPARFPSWRVLKTAGNALLVALLIAIIEESVFRGFLLGALMKKTSRIIAVLISSLYFTSLHFLSTDWRPTPTDIRWDTGLFMIRRAALHLTEAHPDALLALFTCAVFLALVKLRTPRRSLGYCIGIHAGWVFVMKTFKSITVPRGHSDWSVWVSNFDGIIGYLSTAWLGAVVLLMILWRKPPLASCPT
jgi:uncharacterized protein